jgi:hypothetical protein
MKRLMDVLINYLLKKQIIKLSYIENSFFLYKSLDKKIKLTSSIITFNYSSESPYPSINSNVLSIVDNKNLYIWFTKEKKSRYLFEAYIIFRRLLKEYQNIICIVEGSSYKVVVIQNSIMIATFSKDTISKRDIKLMKNEYQLDDTIILSREEYKNYLEESFKFLTINDLLNILNIQIDIKEFLSKGIYLLALPLLISSISITLLLAGYSFHLEGQRDKLHKEFRDKQQSNREVKRTIIQNENENEIYKELLNEFKYVDKTMALSNILRITDESNMTMFYIKIYNQNIDFIVKALNTKSIPVYIKKLFETNQFEDVKNLNTRKVKKMMVEVTMNAKLKVVK